MPVVARLRNDCAQTFPQILWINSIDELNTPYGYRNGFVIEFSQPGDCRAQYFALTGSTPNSRQRFFSAAGHGMSWSVGHMKAVIRLQCP